LQAQELQRISKNFDAAPTVREMTRIFNRLSLFIVSCVVSEIETQGRAAMIVCWINVALFLHAACNWNGVMIVVSSLSNTSVARLAESWASVPPDMLKRYTDELEVLSKKNFKMLRGWMKKSKSPSVPHLAIFVRDLTAIDESPTLLANG
jgi:hypothetical protein